MKTYKSGLLTTMWAELFWFYAIVQVLFGLYNTDTTFLTILSFLLFALGCIIICGSSINFRSISISENDNVIISNKTLLNNIILFKGNKKELDISFQQRMGYSFILLIDKNSERNWSIFVPVGARKVDRKCRELLDRLFND